MSRNGLYVLVQDADTDAEAQELALHWLRTEGFGDRDPYEVEVSEDDTRWGYFRRGDQVLMWGSVRWYYTDGIHMCDKWPNGVTLVAARSFDPFQSDIVMAMDKPEGGHLSEAECRAHYGAVHICFKF